MHQLSSSKKVIHILLLACLLGAVLLASFFAAQAVEQSTVAQGLVASFGYLGVLFIAIIAGLNAIIPIPAATFVPIFIAGGLVMPFIIAMLALGTIIADLVGYYLGRYGSTYVTMHYPRTYAKIKQLHETHSVWLPWFVLIYASFVPFPNEAYLIPFGILGIPLRIWILPVIIGAIIYQTLSAYGVENIFRFFF
jgi:membrane protein DedA with SNARE-associated domain